MASDDAPRLTTCPYCGVGCGVAARPKERAVAIAGDPAHPANFGRLCSKGAALGQTVGLKGRLLHPTIGDRPVSWGHATALVASRFKDTIARHGRDSVAFYVSGQLLTEDYYVANKLMKGFIGSGNIDTNSRLCMASAVVAHKLAFGADLVPGCYEDLDLADLIVFSGHNAAWTHPVLFRRMEQARGRGQRHVVIDPRRTDTAEDCDLHLAIAPQMDVRLWNGLLADLIRRGVVDRRFVAAHVQGFFDVEIQLARDDQSPGAVAAECGVATVDLERFYRMFAETHRTVSLFSMGANQSAQGVAKGLAIINAHLATGRIGKPGAAPFSITGQPNAMGGRETGGMATTLAAHMDFDPESRARVGRFWGSTTVAEKPGLTAVDMFDAVADGRIKAIWIMATNPAVSLPNSEAVRKALASCPFVVVSDCMAETDTMAFAHVKLPALGWGEKDGTVTNSERRISRQRPLFEPAGEARADWRIIADVATAMGHGEGFGWSSPGSVFREWARMTAYENDGRRLLDLGALTGMTPAVYEAMTPVQWPVTSGGDGKARLFADGRFQTPTGRATMIPVEARGPAEATDAAFPLALNSGRVRDHWHTMTRTGLSADLCRHAPEPYVEIHPDDAGPLGLSEGDLTRVQTSRAEAVVVARISDRQRRGSIFMPMHWSDAYAPSGRVNGLVAPNVDARSGQPEFKHTPARARPYRETWRGFYFSRHCKASPRPALVWRRIPQQACQLHEFAGRGDASEREAVRKSLLGVAPAEIVRFEDAATGVLREAHLRDGKVEQVFFATTQGRLPPRDWLAELFALDSLNAEQRASLLVGRELGRSADRSALICTCRNVRRAAIDSAIAAGARTADAVSDRTTAGSVCGSCRPEIGRLLKPVFVEETRHAA